MKKLTKLFLMTIMLLSMPMTAYASSNSAEANILAYFLLNLFLYILIHPLPLLVYRYCIVKEPISPKKANKIIRIYGLILAFLNGYFVGSYGYISIAFWSVIISYFLTKGYKDDVENDLNQAIKNSSSQMSQENELSPAETVQTYRPEPQQVVQPTPQYQSPVVPPVSNPQPKIQPVEQAQRTVNTVACPNCQATIDEDAKFCNYCGIRLNEVLYEKANKTVSNCDDDDVYDDDCVCWL